MAVTMFRFNITNNQDGRKFVVEAPALPNPQPPEWGPSPAITQTDMTAEIAAATQLETDMSNMRQAAQDFLNNPSPTNAQVVAAVKALVRIQLRK